MPNFSNDIDIDVDEFYYSCSRKEKTELIELLIDDGFLNSKGTIKNHQEKNLIELEWENTIINLLEKRLNISNEDEELIKKISKKY